MLRRLCSIVLSLAVAMGLVTALSGTASATNYQVIDWHVDRITDGGTEHAQRYWNLIDAIHQHTYGSPTYQDGIRQTTNEHRLIQVRALDTDNRHLASVYLWADNLYVAGFYAPATNTHLVFSDRVQEFQNALGITNARIMPRTGSYSGLPGGNNRENLVLTPQTMYHAMQQLNNATEYNDNVGQALLVSIQVFSEAARFSPIFNRVGRNIRNYENTQLGPDYAMLENQWGSISQFTYDVRQRAASIRILGNLIQTLAQLRDVLGFVEVNGSIAKF
ncbi:ribosome-inactivating family protein [Streptomyces sp. NPDC006660]|uniref:ribosome-inactivating family protein n=1 Tax=Streptomyces sp. NPDC006660 TaxID=3156901 RepID=UPI0033EA6DDC